MKVPLGYKLFTVKVPNFKNEDNNVISDNSFIFKIIARDDEDAKIQIFNIVNAMRTYNVGLLKKFGNISISSEDGGFTDRFSLDDMMTVD